MNKKFLIFGVLFAVLFGILLISYEKKPQLKIGLNPWPG